MYYTIAGKAGLGTTQKIIELITDLTLQGKSVEVIGGDAKEILGRISSELDKRGLLSDPPEDLGKVSVSIRGDKSFFQDYDALFISNYNYLSTEALDNVLYALEELDDKLDIYVEYQLSANSLLEGVHVSQSSPGNAIYNILKMREQRMYREFDIRDFSRGRY